MPAVEVVGIVVDRGPDLDAILVTRFLEYSTTYRALFSSPRVGQPTDRLLDALVELLVRLHLSGFFWGDCSLSNTLFRYDAGTLGAYLVDAETSEQHPGPDRRAAELGRRARGRAGQRRAASTCRRATCCRPTSTRWRPARKYSAGTRRCGRS